MTPSNNVSILPFYDSVDQQDHRKYYSFGVTKPVVSTAFKVPPFQIIRDHDPSNPDPIISKGRLVNVDTGAQIDIQYQLIAAGLNIKKFASEGYDVIIFPSKLMFPTVVIPFGVYYIELSDGNNDWYSDLIEIIDDVTELIKLEYYDRGNLEFTGGHIDYSDGFRNFIYIDAELNRPEYKFEEEVKDRDGYTFFEKQISEKVFKFSFFAVEHTCDALRLVRLHDFVNVYFAGKTYAVDNIVIEPKWQSQANIAEVNVEFECDTVVKKIAKGISGLNQGGDFNDDFNNDFNNE